MSGNGKRYREAAALFELEREYTPVEAMKTVKAFPDAKFDETVEVAFRLGVDPRKADQLVRGTVSLPNGSGKSVRVAVFAQGPKATEAKEAGADVVGGDELVEQVMGGDDRLRRGRRDARHDGRGRQGRPGPRTAWPHAEPEDRHRDERHREGRDRTSRAARSSTRRTGPGTST